MYKIILMLLVSALLGLGLTGPALMLHPDYSQTATISEDMGDVVSDAQLQKAVSQEIPQVGHEPLPPPPPPPPDDDDYVLADLGPGN